MKKRKEKKITEGTSKDSADCKDRLCPFHGEQAVKLRGRTFEGTVIKKNHGRVTISFERRIYLSKYERYEKRKTKLHARLPDCLNNIEEGDYIQIEETRPLSKIIHFVVTKLIRKNEAKE